MWRRSKGYAIVPSIVSGSCKLQDVERVEERDASCHCSRHTLEDKGAG